MESCLAPQMENGMLGITGQDTARRHYKALYPAPEPSCVKAGRSGNSATGNAG
jgi:hypothetical protein